MAVVPGGGGTGGGGTSGDKKDDDVVITDTVTFISDGETVSTQKIERGKSAKLPTAPKRDGAEFLYWSLEENGDEVDVESYVINGSTTFYAVFKIEETNPNDPEVIAALEKGIKQIKEVGLSETKQMSVKRSVLKTMQAVLQDAYDGIFVDSDYIKKTYKEDVDAAKKEVKSWDKAVQSDFYTRLRNGVDDETFNILTDYFLDEEDKEEYLGDK